MIRERKEHTLQPTALVNEAFLRLVDVHGVQWQDRAHFFALSAQMMRRILVNYALARGAGKRAGSARKVSLDEAMIASPERDCQVVKLDMALDELAKRKRFYATGVSRKPGWRAKCTGRTASELNTKAAPQQRIHLFDRPVRGPPKDSCLPV
jgi:hypothetical protein